MNRYLSGFLCLLAAILLAAALSSQSPPTRLLCSRISLMLGMLGVVGLGLSSQRVRKLFRRFFTEDDSALNLAVARIIVFYLIFRRVGERKAEILFFSGLSPEGFERSFGTGWWDVLPISVGVVEPLTVLLQLSALMALMGLGTQLFAPLSVLLAYFLFGISLRYGLVGHGALHPLWFAAILAVSRCSDALSMDALVRRFRNGAAPVRRSSSYALPLRFMWLLLGIIYFFPGFWKIWDNGVDWFTSNQIVHLMHSLWHRNLELSPIPGFRLDHYPALAGLSALATVVFELGFLLLLFSPRTRVLAAALALLFHRALAYFIRIGFPFLQAVLPILIDWDKLFRKIGILPPQSPEPEPKVSLGKDKLVIVVGGLLLLGNLLAGVCGQESGWPFSSYPTFRHASTPLDRSLAVKVVFHDDTSEILRDKELKVEGQSSLLFRLLRHYALAENPRIEPIRKMLSYTAAAHPNFQRARSATVMIETVYADPDKWEDAQVSQDILFEMDLERR